MMTLYFTATGNSLHLAKEIGGTLLSIPQLLKTNQHIFEDDVVGIVFPCYGGGLPLIIDEFLSKVKIKADYIFGIATYGAMPGMVLGNLESTASRHGIRFQYLNQIIMVDNYLPMFHIEKELENIEKKKIPQNMLAIKKSIEKREELKPSYGFLDKSFGKMLSGGVDKMLGGSVDKRFNIDTNCNLCGTCKRVCPVGNIVIDSTVNFKHNCEGCLACIHNCPQKSIHITKEKSSRRYRNESVSLAEIITSNEQ